MPKLDTKQKKKKTKETPQLQTHNFLSRQIKQALMMMMMTVDFVERSENSLTVWVLPDITALVDWA